MPSRKKPFAELDANPKLWPADKHPPLFEACQEPQTAKASQARMEKAARQRAEEGKPERFRAVDVWPLVVQQNIQDKPEAPEVLMVYAKRAGGPAMVDFLFNNWAKLPELISRSWKIEKVEEYIDTAQKSRLDVLWSAWKRPCVCNGLWHQIAEDILCNNEIDKEVLCSAVLTSLAEGRSHGNLVCRVGHEGDEGKGSR